MQITITLNEQKINQKVTNDKVGLFTSHEWHRLINPYTPCDKGNLMQNVDEQQPFKLHYRAPYAAKMYEGLSDSGKPFDYRKRNPYATDHWDMKAAQAGQVDKLAKAINDYLRR